MTYVGKTGRKKIVTKTYPPPLEEVKTESSGDLLAQIGTAETRGSLKSLFLKPIYSKIRQTFILSLKELFLFILI